jgi:hypothetical protein
MDNKEMKVIHVIDIESDVVKDLLLFKIKAIRDSLDILSEKIAINEELNKYLKQEIKQIYLNSKAKAQNFTDPEQRKLAYQKNIEYEADEISVAQYCREQYKKTLSSLHKEKVDMKKQLAYYNSIADAYKILLYKDKGEIK